MPNPRVAELIELLTLERLEDNLFRGTSRDIGTRYVFGAFLRGSVRRLANVPSSVSSNRPSESKSRRPAG